MPKVLIYTDCDFFAGCENMVAVLLNNEVLSETCEINCFYRFSREYERGVSGRVKDPERVYGVRMFLFRRRSLPVFLRNELLFRIAWRLLSILLAPFSLVFNFIKLCSIFQKESPDLLIVNNGGYPGSGTSLLAVLAAKLMKVSRIVLIVNNITTKPNFLFSYYARLRDKLVFNAVEAVITGGQVAGDAMVRVRGLPPSKSMTIPNGIDALRFRMADILHRRSKLFSRDDSLLFGIVGLHEHRKGHMVLLRALKLLFERRPELRRKVTLRVEGCGDLTKQLSDFVARSDLNANVEFMSDVREMSAFYRDIDILIHPSLHSEDLPNVISEALLFGIPVIGSDLAGIPSQVIHMQTGLLIPPGNVEALSNAMIAMLDDPVLVGRMAEDCINIFYENFDSQVAANRYMDLILQNCEDTDEA